MRSDGPSQLSFSLTSYLTAPLSQRARYLNIAPWLGQRSPSQPPMEVGHLRLSRPILHSHTILASTLLLNLRAIMETIFNQTRVTEQADFVDANRSIASSTTSKKYFRIIQPLLASLLTTGLDCSADVICRETLGIVGDHFPSGLVWSVLPGSHPRIEVDVSNSNRGALSIINGVRPDAVWRISPEVTAWRLLAICTLLRVCLGLESKPNPF